MRQLSRPRACTPELNRAVAAEKRLEKRGPVSFRCLAFEDPRAGSAAAKSSLGLLRTRQWRLSFYSHATSERDCELKWVRFAEMRERLRPNP
jgi:hypothetical protein